MNTSETHFKPLYTLEKIYLGDSYRVIGATVYKEDKRIFTIENSCNLKSDIFITEINNVLDYSGE
jgi:hypothetical protein